MCILRLLRGSIADSLFPALPSKAFLTRRLRACTPGLSMLSRLQAAECGSHGRPSTLSSEPPEWPWAFLGHRPCFSPPKRPGTVSSRKGQCKWASARLSAQGGLLGPSGYRWHMCIGKKKPSGRDNRPPHPPTLPLDSARSTIPWHVLCLSVLCE